MTDWRRAGERADASRIRSVLQQQFAGDGKYIVRKEVIAYLRACGVERPLDLWGGGLSAEMMVHAGLRPIVIDDARVADRVGESLGQKVTKTRFLRSMRISGDMAGYETRMGGIAKHAGDADGAFLDLCGHWSPHVDRALRACRHMRAVVVTLMPERTAIGHLSVDNWLTAYKALVREATGMVPTTTRVYVRNTTGQRAVVFMLRPRFRGICVPRVVERVKERLSRPEIKARAAELARIRRANDAGWKERRAEWLARPEVQARIRETRRAYNQRPEVKERQRRRDRERSADRWARDPAYREYHREYQREYQRRRRAVQGKAA